MTLAPRAAVRSSASGAGLLAFALAAIVAPLGAQQPVPRDTSTARRDTTAVARPAAGPVAPRPVGAAPADTGRRRPRTVRRTRDPLLDPPIAPSSAFFRSFALPGWGEWKLGRKKSAAIFFAVEVGTWVWAGKAYRDLDRAKALRGDSVQTGTDDQGRPVFAPAMTEALVSARRLHFEDALAVLAANHLLSGADAYVSAHLWDLPARVSIRALPRGAVVAAQLRW